MAAPRSLVLTASVLLASVGLLATFGGAFVAPAGHSAAAEVSAPVAKLPAATLGTAALAMPAVAHADEGSVWVPALSAVGAGFAIGLAAIGSGVGQGIASGRCIDGISR